MNGATTAFAVVATTPGTANEVVVLPYTTFVRPLEERGGGGARKCIAGPRLRAGGQSFFSPDDDDDEAWERITGTEITN